MEEGIECIEGEIDISTINEVTERVLANPATNVVLDADRLVFIDRAA
jgi:hypothetical protein